MLIAILILAYLASLFFLLVVLSIEDENETRRQQQKTRLQNMVVGRYEDHILD